MKRFTLSLLVLALAMLACSAPQVALPSQVQNIVGTPIPTVAPTPNNAERQLKILDEIYTALKADYVFTDYGGVNLEELKKEHETKIKAGLSNEAFEKGLNEFAAKFPNSSVTYETRAQRLQAEADASIKYSGIGAYVAVRSTPEPHVVILSVIQDSPAEKAGLQPHDSVYSIDGKPVTPEEGLEVIKRVRGEAGTTVSLEVQSPGKSKRTVKITRAEITSGDVLRGGLLQRSGIVYFLFPVTSPDDLADTIAQNMDGFSQTMPLRGVILDLRVAHGANFPLEELLTIFGDGEVGQFYNRAKAEPFKITGQDFGGSQKLPIVILVGPDTEGAPEIFASALQSSKRAVVLGMNTSGKIFGYTPLPLADGARLTFISSSFKNAKGDDLGKAGVKPDVVISTDWDQITGESDPPLERALQGLLSLK